MPWITGGELMIHARDHKIPDRSREGQGDPTTEELVDGCLVF